MKATQIIKVSLFLVAALALAFLGRVGWIMTAGLRTAVRVPEPNYWPTDGWRTSTPEEQGFDSVKLAQGLKALQDKQVTIDSLMLIRNGYVVLDAHFAPYDGSFPHDLASVTKSVMTTLIAMAAEQGKLDLDAPAVSFFPGRKIANLDERKNRLTVRQLTGMVNGMESGCVDEDEANLDKMRATPDWVQAALDRPMVAEPGTKFCYDSPGMHLLSAILQEATGMTALDFARQNLFVPLGIRNVLWEIDPQGRSRGWGDLHLLPEDAAKIGLLWLQRGKWDGRQIVPEAWVLDSVKPHSKFVKTDFGYGYGWWVSPGDFHAAGRGSQRIRVIAYINTILVTTGGGDYDYGVISEWLVPALLQLKDSRPANPQGLAALEKVVAGVGQDAPAWANSAVPEMARSISGLTYRCDNNPATIESVRMQFDGSKQAAIFLKMGGADQVLPIGLDGQFRLAADDGTGYRGYWEDERTFQLEAFDIGLLHRRVVFSGDSLKVDLPEVELTIACRVPST